MSKVWGIHWHNSKPLPQHRLLRANGLLVLNHCVAIHTTPLNHTNGRVRCPSSQSLNGKLSIGHENLVFPWSTYLALEFWCCRFIGMLSTWPNI